MEGRYAKVYPTGLTAFTAKPTPSLRARRPLRRQEWWATLSYQPQLFGSPSPNGGRALDEYEKREPRLKIGYNF